VAAGRLRGRLLGLAPGWGVGVGPVALLAGLPREQHELGLIAFGLLLRARGWRIVYLGPDTPLDTVEALSADTEPDLIVLTALDRKRVTAVSDRLRALAGRRPVAVGGTAAAGAASKIPGVRALRGDVVTEAAALTARSGSERQPGLSPDCG